MDQQHPAFAQCPKCGQHVTVGEDGVMKRHARHADLGAGSHKCSFPNKRQAASAAAARRAQAS